MMKMEAQGKGIAGLLYRATLLPTRYGLIAIAPAFYEGAATIYYGFRNKNGERKSACKNPIIERNGVLRPPAGASRYTLAYWILSKRPMSEKALVRMLLLLYGVSGVIAITLSVT